MATISSMTDGLPDADTYVGFIEPADALVRRRPGGPVPIPSALTWQEILIDAGAPIFADAFGSSD